MKIFVSWSGGRSRQLASIVRGVLSDAIQRVQPFMSDEDIEAGDRWGGRLNAELQSTDFGIICLTAENLESRWIHYEAGALAKTIENSRIVPCLLGIQPSDVKFPLAQFQAKSADKAGMFDSLRSINTSLGTDLLPPERLQRTFDWAWTTAEEKIKEMPASEVQPKQKDLNGFMEEMLAFMRKLARRDSTPLRSISRNVVDVGAKQEAKALGQLAAWCDTRIAELRLSTNEEAMQSKILAECVEALIRSESSIPVVPVPVHSATMKVVNLCTAQAVNVSEVIIALIELRGACIASAKMLGG